MKKKFNQKKFKFYVGKKLKFYVRKCPNLTKKMLFNIFCTRPFFKNKIIVFVKNGQISSCQTSGWVGAGKSRFNDCFIAIKKIY